MPETACLHIQARESDPIRVVELPGTSVRIGRASYCEVRLSEPELAEEECRLKRRGGSWQLVPSRGSLFVWFDGRSVAEACPLPFDAPFRVGEHWLTLRPTATSVPGWSDYQAPRPSIAATTREEFRPASYRDPVGPVEPPRPAAPVPPAAVSTADSSDHLARWKERHDERVGRLKSGQGEKRWEERWRAAGERLRARAAAGAPPLSPAPSVPPVPTSSPTTGPIPASAAEPKRQPKPGSDYGVPERAAAPPLRPIPMLEPPAARRDEPAAPSDTGLDDLVGWTSPTTPSETVVGIGDGVDADATFGDPAEWAPPTLAADPEPVAAPGAIEARRVETELPSAPLSLDVPLEDQTIAEVTPERSSEPVPVPALLVDRLPGDAGAAGVSPSGPDLKSETPADFRHPHDQVESSPLPAIDEPEPRHTAAVEPAESVVLTSAERNVEETTVAAPAAAEPAERPGFFTRTRFLWTGANRELRILTPSPAPTAHVDSRGARTASPEPAARPRVGGTRTASEPARPAGRAGKPDDRPSARPVAAAPSSGFGAGRTPPASAPPASGGATRGRQSTASPGSNPGGAKPSDRQRSRATAAGSAAAEPGREWPSATDILAAHRLEATRAATPRPSPHQVVREPIPTEAREPAQWTLPAWIAVPPALAIMLAAGTLVCALSWAWSTDAQSTAVVAGLLAAPGNEVKPLPEKIAPPGSGWWKSSPSNLVRWALYFDRLGATDPLAGERAGELLDTAARSSPLHAQVRFAMARRAPAPGEAMEPIFPSLGLSRDVEALAWTGRQWQRAGKPGPALKAYRAALEMAARAELSHLKRPGFDDEPRVQRYRLPGEDLVGQTVREMARQEGWTFDTWSEALPPSALVWLATARVLRELASPDAEKAVDAIIAKLADPPPAGCSPAIHRAAQAEALAMKEQWKEADARYREAIELEHNDAVRRSWWVNVAEIEQKQFDESARQKALEAAKGDDANDEIAQRAIDLLKYTGAQGEKSRASR